MPGLRRAALATALVLAAAAALAHADAPVVRSAWTGGSLVVVGLLASALGYALGLRRLWASAGTGRGVSAARALAFAGGWLALALALLSPLDALAQRSFAVHMVQHELMMVVAAPLMCLGRPLVAWTWALPLPARRVAGGVTRTALWSRAWAALTAPLAAWVLHAVALWGWHAPAAFDAALHDEALHTLQHLSFLASALLFWWAVLKPSTRHAEGVALAMLFTTMLHMGALGALLTLAPRPWYAGYGEEASMFGLDALADQQLGGLIMWVPSGLAYLAAALAQVARWFERPPAAARRSS